MVVKYHIVKYHLNIATAMPSDNDFVMMNFVIGHFQWNSIEGLDDNHLGINNKLSSLLFTDAHYL